MAVIVLVAGVAMPSFTGLIANSRLRAGVRGLLSHCRLARDLAITRGTYTRVVIDEVTGQYSLLVYVKPDTKTKDPSVDSTRSGWQPTTDSLAGPRVLPEGISFHRVISSDTGGEPQVTFSPDGRAQDFLLSLRDPSSRRLGLKVVGTTGLSSIISPEDRDEFARLDGMATKP